MKDNYKTVLTRIIANFLIIRESFVANIIIFINSEKLGTQILPTCIITLIEQQQQQQKQQQ